MFRVKPRATLGLIFFTVLIQKSEEKWKVLGDCPKNWPSGIPQGKFVQTKTADFSLFIPYCYCKSSHTAPKELVIPHTVPRGTFLAMSELGLMRLIV